MNKKTEQSMFIEVITDAVIIWLPVDLLYLYFADGWMEPNPLVLHLELVMLLLLPVFGIYRLCRFIKAKGAKINTGRAEKEIDQLGR